jgi:hypothetical protein
MAEILSLICSNNPHKRTRTGPLADLNLLQKGGEEKEEKKMAGGGEGKILDILGFWLDQQQQEPLQKRLCTKTGPLGDLNPKNTIPKLDLLLPIYSATKMNGLVHFRN